MLLFICSEFCGADRFIEMTEFKDEQTLILIELTGKKITQVKEEIIKSALKRKDYGDTVLMVNLSLNEIYITTTSKEFIKHLFSNKNYFVKIYVNRLSSAFKNKLKDSPK